MILEGIVTTTSASGEINIAPMGPRVDADMKRFLLRPFNTSTTYRNLRAHGEGVLHVTDDVLLLARTALGQLEPLPALMPAQRDSRLGACAMRADSIEFRVVSIDDREERVSIDVEVVHQETLRDFFGFNRAKHAVVEAAILATRTAFLAAGGDRSGISQARGDRAEDRRRAGASRRSRSCRSMLERR